MSDEQREDQEQPEPRIRVHDKRVHADPEAPGADPLEEVARELEEARATAEERLDQLLRVQADFANARKRMTREQTEITERASLRIVERLLPVLDDVERALEAARTAGDENIARGVEMVFNKLYEVLVEEGLERVEAQGSAFDPREHEALSSVPGEVDEPTVLEVVRPGYRLKGRTVRPALVNVATPPAEGGE